MRIKGYLILMLCIVITSVFYCIIGDPKPSLQNIVSETNRQLSQPLKRLKDVVVPAVADSSSYYLGGTNNADEQSELNEKLESLGFVEPPRLFPADVWRNATLPVFVSAVKNGEADPAVAFIRSVQINLPDTTLILYDLGLDDDELNLVSYRPPSSCVRSIRFQ